jgi:hypothetical protein
MKKLTLLSMLFIALQVQAEEIKHDTLSPDQIIQELCPNLFDLSLDGKVVNLVCRYGISKYMEHIIVNNMEDINAIEAAKKDIKLFLEKIMILDKQGKEIRF